MKSSIGIYNHLNHSYIWYHSTLRGLASKIQKEGLRIYSIPTYQESPEPRIYVSTRPFMHEPDFITFQVNLRSISWDYAKWPFHDDAKPLKSRWQLCIYKDIPPNLLSVLNV